MGWFWSTAPPPKPAGDSRGTTTAAPPPRPPPAQTDDDSDPELQKFLAMFAEELRGSSTAAKAAPPASTDPAPPPARPRPSSWFSWPSSAATAPSPPPAVAPPDAATPLAPAYEPSASAVALAESLLPETMSCRQAFDLAWGCQSPVGQFNAVYRYGSPRPCGELWGDFWFCMRARALGPEHKKAAVREHYRRKEARKYGGGRPSSEDVWRGRDDKVAPGTAFATPLDDAPDVTDEEQMRADIERRRRVREELGYEKPSG